MEDSTKSHFVSANTSLPIVRKSSSISVSKNSHSSKNNNNEISLAQQKKSNYPYSNPIQFSFVNENLVKDVEDTLSPTSKKFISRLENNISNNKSSILSLNSIKSNININLNDNNSLNEKMLKNTLNSKNPNTLSSNNVNKQSINTSIINSFNKATTLNVKNNTSTVFRNSLVQSNSLLDNETETLQIKDNQIIEKNPLLLSPNTLKKLEEEEENKFKDNYLREKVNKYKKLQKIEFRDRTSKKYQSIKSQINFNRDIKDLNILRQTKISSSSLAFFNNDNKRGTMQFGNRLSGRNLIKSANSISSNASNTNRISGLQNKSSINNNLNSHRDDDSSNNALSTKRSRGFSAFNKTNTFNNFKNKNLNNVSIESSNKQKIRKMSNANNNQSDIFNFNQNNSSVHRSILKHRTANPIVNLNFNKTKSLNFNSDKNLSEYNNLRSNINSNYNKNNVSNDSSYSIIKDKSQILIRKDSDFSPANYKINSLLQKNSSLSNMNIRGSNNNINFSLLEEREDYDNNADLLNNYSEFLNRKLKIHADNRNNVRVDLNKGTRLLDTTSKYNYKQGQNNILSLKEKYKTKEEMQIEKKNKINTEKKKKKINNVFRTGLSEKDYIRSYINKGHKIIHNEEIKEKANLTNKKKPFVFEFNYEQRKYEDPLFEYKTSYIENSFKPVESAMKFYNIKCQNNLMKQIAVNNQKPFQITPQDLFNERYQVCKDIMNIDEDITIKRELNRLSKKKHIENKNLNKHNKDNEGLSTYSIIDNKADNKNENERFAIRIKLRNFIIFAAIQFKRLKLTLDDLYSPDFLPVTPYQLEYSKDFLTNVREGEYDAVYKFLRKNKLYARCFDQFGQTALHIAAKKNYKDIIKLLISFGVIIDTEDFARRTPLHLACNYNHLETIKILLFENANPLKKNIEGLKPGELSDNSVIKYLLLRVEKLYNLYSGTNPKKVVERVNNSLNFIFNEFEVIFYKNKKQ